MPTIRPHEPLSNPDKFNRRIFLTEDDRNQIRATVREKNAAKSAADRLYAAVCQARHLIAEARWEPASQVLDEAVSDGPDVDTSLGRDWIGLTAVSHRERADRLQMELDSLTMASQPSIQAQAAHQWVLTNIATQYQALWRLIQMGPEAIVTARDLSIDPNSNESMTQALGELDRAERQGLVYCRPKPEYPTVREWSLTPFTERADDADTFLANMARVAEARGDSLPDLVSA